jgi:capsular polysaccharide biosynthesis protein
MSANPELNLTSRFPPHSEPVYPNPIEEEISLIDVWLVLVRRRTLVLACTVLGSIAGLAFILIFPPKYIYTTTIEIGTKIINGEVSPIESQDSVRAKVEERYIPLVLQEHQHSLAEEEQDYKIEVKAPKNSQIIVLTSEGREDEEQAQKALHRAVVEMIQGDHRRISNVLRKNLEAKIVGGERRINNLKDSAQILRAKVKRLDQEQALLATEIEQTQALITAAERNREQAAQEVKDGTQVMTKLLLISEELRSSHTRLTELKERQLIEIPDKQDDLNKGILEILRTQEDEKANIEDLRLAITGMLETRAVKPPLRLPEPIGLGKPAILVVAVLVGLMLGVFVAFFAEFLAKARTRMKDY